MIAAYQNMVGTTLIGEKKYTFWAGSSELGLYPDRSTQVWFEAGDTRAAPIDSTHPFPKDPPYLIGQVIDVDGDSIDWTTFLWADLRCDSLKSTTCRVSGFVPGRTRLNSGRFLRTVTLSAFPTNRREVRSA